MKKTLLALTICLLAAHHASAEQIDMSDNLTITTYYPSPYGVYGTLKLHPRETPTGQCREGELFYHMSDSKGVQKGVHVCNENLQWQPLAGTGVPDPLPIGRVVIGDFNNDGLISAADIPPVSRPLYVRNPNGDPNILAAAFVNNLNYGVAVGPPTGYTVGMIQSNFFQNGGGMVPPAADLAINPGGGNVSIGMTVAAERLTVNGTVYSNNARGTGNEFNVPVATLRTFQGCVPAVIPDTAFQDSMTSLEYACTASACRRYCRTTRGYHSGTANEWDHIQQRINCFCD